MTITPFDPRPQRLPHAGSPRLRTAGKRYFSFNTDAKVIGIQLTIATALDLSVGRRLLARIICAAN